jgi:hypothetical protein
MKKIKSFVEHIKEDLDVSTKQRAFQELENRVKDLKNPDLNRNLRQLGNIYRSLSGRSNALKNELQNYIREVLGISETEILSRNLSIRGVGNPTVEFIVRDNQRSILLHLVVNPTGYRVGNISDRDFLDRCERDIQFWDLVDSLAESIQKDDIYTEK